MRQNSTLPVSLSSLLYYLSGQQLEMCKQVSPAQCQPAGRRISLCLPRRTCSWYARRPLHVRVQTLLPRLGLCAGVLSLTVY